MGACGGVDEDLVNYEILTDDQILQIASEKDHVKDEDEIAFTNTSKVFSSETVNALHTALQWTEDLNMDSTESCCCVD